VNKLIVLLIAVTVMQSCNKPSEFGKELVEGSNISWKILNYTSLSAKSIPGDSILTYYAPNPGRNLTSFKVGEIFDAALGRITAETFAQFQIVQTSATALKDATIDSIIWTIRYDPDTTHQFGNFSNPISLDVYRITEDVNATKYDSLYTNQRFETENTPVASADNYLVAPYPRDSSVLKFRFTEDFGNYLKSLPDSAFSNSKNLQQYFEGLNIRPRGLTNNLISLILSDKGNSLTIYYTENSTQDKKSIVLSASYLATRNHVSITRDLSGSRLASYYANPTGDSLLYIQGLGGPKVEMTLPDMDSLKQYLLLQAELQMPVADANGSEYSLPGRIWVYKKDGNGRFVSIADGVSAINANGLNGLGGTPEKFTDNGVAYYRYNIRITEHLKEVIKGTESNILYLSSLAQGTDPGRAVLNGSGTLRRPLTLRLIISKKL